MSPSRPSRAGRAPPSSSETPGQVRSTRRSASTSEPPRVPVRQPMGLGAVRGAEGGVLVAAHLPSPQTAGLPPISPPSPLPRPSWFHDPPTPPPPVVPYLLLPSHLPCRGKEVGLGSKGKGTGTGKGASFSPSSSPRQGDFTEVGAPPAAPACSLWKATPTLQVWVGPSTLLGSSPGPHPGPGSRCGLEAFNCCLWPEAFCLHLPLDLRPQPYSLSIGTAAGVPTETTQGP